MAERKIAASRANRLQRSGLKQTLQRTLVMRALDASVGHLSAEEVAVEVEKMSGVSMNRSTVYRILDDLEQADLVQTVRIGRVAYHEMARGGDAHYHFTCSRCGATDDLQWKDLDRELKARGGEAGYVIETVDLLVTGTCPRCQQEEVASRSKAF